jgi:uncharacterized protein YndB with AHSA1/START domain
MNSQQALARSVQTAPGTIRIERLLPGPVERAWAYLVESDKRAKWLAAGEFDLRVGGKIELRFDNGSLPNEKPLPEQYKGRGVASFTGVITRLEPLKVLAHTWKWGDSDTEVTYELTPRGKEVLLTIVHSRMPTDSRLGVMAGWDVHSGILADLLEGKSPRPFWAEHDKLEKEYAATA